MKKAQRRARMINATSLGELAGGVPAEAIHRKANFGRKMCGRVLWKAWKGLGAGAEGAGVSPEWNDLHLFKLILQNRACLSK